LAIAVTINDGRYLSCAKPLILLADNQFIRPRGRTLGSIATQVDFIDKELNSTESGTRAKLMAARTPEEAAGAFIDFDDREEAGGVYVATGY
jgi:hypothetical protein